MAGTKSLFGNNVGYDLNNSKAGLIDLNINQQQKQLVDVVLILLSLLGVLLLKIHKRTKKLDSWTIRNCEKGEFPDWLMPAIINDFKVRELGSLCK